MKRKVIIKSVPQAQSGLEVKMNNLRAGLGFNANKMPWPVMAGKMSAPDVEVNSTLQPVPRDQANLEAEKGEVASLPTKSGVPDTFKIGGKRHHSGGTPLNLPGDSFIYSDTAKMKIKDPTVLAQFGLSEKKGGYTPAEIAKKYDVNSFKKILMDPDTDKLQKQTAELMISNYNLKLAKLAIVQESMKGFPQGIPAVAMPYIEEMGIDPAQFVQMNPGGAQDEQSFTQQTQMDDVGAEAQSRFGGFMQMGGDVDYFQDGGLTRAQLESAEREILGHIQKLRSNNIAVPENLANAYNRIQTLKRNIKAAPVVPSAVPQNYSWINPEGIVAGDPRQGATGYWDRVRQNWTGGPDIGNIDPAGIEEAFKTKEKVYKHPSLKAQKAQEIINKAIHPSQTEGVMDYLGNILSIPGAGTSGLLTGNIETAGQTYLRHNPGNTGTAMFIDFASDPTTYLGAAGAKGAYLGSKAAVKNIPKAYAWATYLIPEYYGLGKEFVKKYGPKALDAVQNLIKNPTARQVAENVALSGATRLASAGAYDKYSKDLAQQNEILKQEIAKLQAAPSNLNVTPPINSKPATKTQQQIDTEAKIAKEKEAAEAKLLGQTKSAPATTKTKPATQSSGADYEQIFNY